MTSSSNKIENELISNISITKKNNLKGTEMTFYSKFKQYKSSQLFQIWDNRLIFGKYKQLELELEIMNNFDNTWILEHYIVDSERNKKHIYLKRCKGCQDSWLNDDYQDYKGCLIKFNVKKIFELNHKKRELSIPGEDKERLIKLHDIHIVNLEETLQL